MRISAKADYAVRAAVQLAAAAEGPTKGDAIAQAQGIPLKFLENILGDLRHAGLVRSQRGADGGYWLDRPAGEITVADIIRAVEGPLASVRGQRPEDVAYAGAAPSRSRRSGSPSGRACARSPRRHAGRHRRRRAAAAGRAAGERPGGVGHPVRASRARQARRASLAARLAHAGRADPHDVARRELELPRPRRA